MTAPIKVVYVTSNPFKIEEIRVLAANCQLADGRKVSEVFQFDVRQLNIVETLEVDLEAMVRAEVSAAYTQTRVPCIVEHAGLVFDGHMNYPGGLTKPMWKALDDRFVSESGMVDRPATARAVVAYCDGMSIRTFVGETRGTLVAPPRGHRSFYWDTVFVPEDAKGLVGSRTYAQVVDEPSLGLAYKVQHLSQSREAMLKFLEHRIVSGLPDLWQ